MKSIALLQNLAEKRYLPWSGAILGALLAAWVIFQSHGIINNDGILYIEVAKQFDAGEWRKAFALYNWPLYPLLIAAIHQISNLSFQASAHLLAILFFALTSAGVITLVKEVGGDRRVMLAAGLLLLGSPSMVGSYVPMLVRDHGFWASHVWSIVFFLRFHRTNTWKNALSWGGLALTAMLFRIEGVAYLVMLPLVLLAQRETSWKNRIASIFKAHALLISVATVLVAVLVIHPSISLQNLGRLQDPVNVGRNVYFQVTQGLAEKSQIYAENVLGSFLDDYAMPGLLLTLAFALLVKAASSAGWLQLAFATYSRKYRENPILPHHNRVFGWLIVLGLINAIFIILSVFVLPKRYVLPIGIVILVYAAFGFTALFDTWQRKPRRPMGKNWVFPAATVAIALQIAILLRPSDPRDGFEQDASRWVQAHASENSRIYYDHGRLRYYATGESHTRKAASWDTVRELIGSDQIRQYDYILVHVSKKLPEQQQFITGQLGTPPLAAFENRRGKQVLIYKVLQQAGNTRPD